MTIDELIQFINDGNVEGLGVATKHQGALILYSKEGYEPVRLDQPFFSVVVVDMPHFLDDPKKLHHLLPRPVDLRIINHNTGLGKINHVVSHVNKDKSLIKRLQGYMEENALKSNELFEVTVGQLVDSDCPWKFNVKEAKGKRPRNPFLGTRNGLPVKRNKQ